MASMKWGWDRRSVNLGFILCALGFHKWAFHCRSSKSKRLDLKVCHKCECRLPVGDERASKMIEISY
jgi:hypothetical protein